MKNISSLTPKFFGGQASDYVPPNGAGAEYARGMVWPGGNPDWSDWWVAYDGGWRPDGGVAYHFLEIAGGGEYLVNDDDPSFIDGGAGCAYYIFNLFGVSFMAYMESSNEPVWRMAA